MFSAPALRFEDLGDDVAIFSSFSGGRTSAFMTWWLKQRCRLRQRLIVLFSNTGREHPRTLDFVRACDENLGFETVWLEAVVNPGAGVGTTHRVVTYETADRGGGPYEEMIKKYGIPNLAFPHCTRELKLRPMHSYLRSLGYEPSKIPTAIGIRADEQRRVKNQANIFYPLIDSIPTDKPDVLDWWSEYPYDLDIEEFEGNCLGCFKKSYAKQFAQLDKDPSVFAWTDAIEKKYANAGSGVGPRVFFRGNRSTEQLIQLRLSASAVADPLIYANDGGCSESCELYETENTEAA